jgi:Zn-dependent protease
MELLTNPLSLIILSLIILIFSAIIHEIAHGYVAERLGDPTARIMGRLTLNPLPHIDPFLSILMPLILILSGSPVIFGGAKPVPVDPFNLREGRKDVALVSLAGPLTNLVIAVIAGLLLKTFFHTTLPSLDLSTDVIQFLLSTILHLNLLLAIFNLLPIPPLDGSKIFALILPEHTANSYLSLGSIGTFLLLFLLMVPIGGFSLMSVVQTIYTFTLSLLGF